MQVGLMDVLLGEFDDGQSIYAVSEEQQQIMSIISHLRRMFNCRRGTIQHLPDYGLPDISEVYEKMPNSVLLLKEAITNCIKKYEPRLKNVRITEKKESELVFRIRFLITAQLISGDRLSLETIFSVNDNADIKPVVGRS